MNLLKLRYHLACEQEAWVDCDLANALIRHWS